MATPSAEILEQSLQNLSPDDICYVFVNSGCNKILQTERQIQQKRVFCFLGAGHFRLDLVLGYRERLLSWHVDCHHHVTSPLIAPSEFLLQGHHSLSVEDCDHTYDLI